MIWHKFGFKGKAVTVAFAGIVLSIGLIWYGVSAVNLAVDAERVWSDSNQTATKTSQLLNRINKHLGYGGLIHNFKNYILRADEKYLLKFQEDITQILSAVEQYREEIISDAERDALSQLMMVVNEYADKVEVARMGFAKGDGIEVVDQIVKVNDLPAFNALSSLSDAALARSFESERVAHSWLEKTVSYLSWGLLIVPLVLLSAAVMVWYLWVALQANRVADVAQQEVESLLQTAPDAMLTVNIQGAIIRANQQAERIFGYSDDELMTMHINDLVPDSVRDHHGQLMNVYFENPHSRSMGKDINIVARTKNGREIPVEVSLSSVQTEQGLFATAIVRDISERLRSALQVRENEERLSLSQSIAKVGTWDWNITTGGLVWSDEIFSIFGVHPNDFEASYDHFLEFIHPDDKDGVIAAVSAAVEKGLPYDIEHRVVWRNGEERFVHEQGEVYRDEDGKPVRMIGVVLDITERKAFVTALEIAKAEADRANAAKSEFLANMSHEIRTPMNAVLGMGYLMQKTPLNTRQSEYINKMMNSARSLLRIINDILDFSKIEAGKLDIEKAPFSLDEVMENVANVVGTYVDTKRLEVMFSTDQDVPRFLIGDQLRLEQALINLGSNAVKFTEQGDVVVRAHVHRELDGGDIMLKFSVQDTGIGLSRAQVSTLFESFQQADTSTTRRFGGTGLGLSITLQLVKLMGGEVSVESELGAGSTFSFTVRLGVQPEQPQLHKMPSQLDGMRALVVDDNPVAREIECEILQSFGLNTTAVSSGEEALTELKRTAKSKEPDYAVVVMDWLMDELDGLETTARIRQNKSMPSTPTIIMVTAYGREMIMEKADHVGLDGFLTKPVIPSVLYDTILEALGHKDHMRSQAALLDSTAGVRPALAGAKILIVEDNLINQQVAQEIISDAGAVVEVVSDGQQACQNICELGQTYDVVLMDLHMPIMDGYAATARLREQFDSDQLVIIAMTANAMRSERQKCIDAGMNDFISKPFDVNDLYALLLKWLPDRASRVLSGAVQIHQDDAAAQSQHHDAQATTDVLPDTLDGFDMVDGLDRMLGRPDLYRRFLLKLDEGHGGDSALIRQALDDGDRDVAHRLAHTVKGVAGNLSAQDLYRVATDLSGAIKRGDEDLDSLLDAFDTQLDRALRSVRSLKVPSQGPVDASQQDIQQSMDVENVEAILKDILGILDNHALGAGKHVKKLRFALEPDDDIASRIDRLEAAIGKLDYITARHRLGELAQRVGVSIEGK